MVTTERGRTRERGAAVFVVVMAITLVTAVGLFAAHSATLVDQAAGHARLARQAQYMTEYGTLLTLAELGTGAGDAYAELIRRGKEVCQATSKIPNYEGCYKFDREFIEGQSQVHSGRTIIEPTATDGTPGSFGRNVTTSGTVSIELSELADAPPTQGTNLKGQYVVTATAFGEINPSSAVCTDQGSVVTNRQALRAFLVFGGGG